MFKKYRTGELLNYLGVSRDTLRFYEEKGFLEQKLIMEPSKYDTSEFVQYSLDVLDEMSGYSFTLIDRSREYIFFPVAWICIDSYDADTCEAAIDFWIS